jgi:hypothetical protein
VALDVQVGYRLFSWFAIEADYEYMNGFKTNSLLASTEIRTSSIMVAPKFLLPFWRAQPYLLVPRDTISV